MNKTIDNQNDKILKSNLKEIEKERNEKENSEAEIARNLHDLSKIRESELEQVGINRTLLNGFVDESKTVLNRFYQSIEDR
jgi:hypothetical protein